MGSVRGERAKVSESGISLVLLVIFLVVAPFSGAEIWLTSLSVAGCGPDQCDYTLQWNTVQAFLVFDAVVVIAVVVLGLIRRHRGARTWWIPGGGIALVLIGAAVAFQVSNIALPVP